MKLKFYKKTLNTGSSRVVVIAWYLFGCVFSSWIPGSYWRVLILKIFKAKIGSGVVIKPRVRIKFPWNLSIGDNCWIGESVWIDNLCDVIIDNDVCISQGVYLCTGSHNWSKATFDLILKPIKIASQVWLCAMSKVGPGIDIGEGAILSLGSIATKSLEPWTVNQGNPATPIKKRTYNLL